MGTFQQHYQWVTWGFCSFCALVMVGVFFFGLSAHQSWTVFFALVSQAPGAFILWWVYWKDYKHHVQLWKVIVCFVAGMSLCLPLTLIEQICKNILESFHPLTLVSALISSFFIAAFWEESAKGVVCYLGTRLHLTDLPNTPNGIWIYAVAGAAGLASFENFLYIVFSSLVSPTQALLTVFFRTILSVPLHCATGGIIGGEVGLNIHGFQEMPLWRVFIIPILLHGVYDFVIFLQSHFLSILVLFLDAAIVVLAIALSRKVRIRVLERSLELPR